MSKRRATMNIEVCVACGVCANQCPREAISIYRGCYAEVDTDKCVGCGICEKACPANVIEVRVIEDMEAENGK
jgi:formate hydrogenlyase subunit 6/NADH:ubiquinone oxidoreductase subunit I